MYCKFSVICKFFQEGGNICGGRVPWNKGLTKESDQTLKTISEKIKIGRAKEKRGSVKQHPDKGTGMYHCKKCEFTALTANAISWHCRREHPKTKAVGRKSGKKAPATKRQYKPRKGKEPITLAPATEKKNKAAEHAFKSLQKRANKGKLTEEQTTAYDVLEPEIIGLPVVRWPDGYPEKVIELHKKVMGKESGEEG